MCEFIVVHELVHPKYDKSSLFGGFKSLIPSGSVKLAFCELRANTIAYEITGSSELDLKNYFDNFYPYSKYAFITYTGGYLKGHEYFDFIRQHPKWDTKTINDATIYLKSYSKWYKLVGKRTYLKIQQKFESVC